MRIPFLLLIMAALAVSTVPVQAYIWQMKQRDVCNTGRADFSIPDQRLNSSLFDIFLWQTPSPGSPSEGAFSSTQMSFYDGAGPGGTDIVVGGYHWPKGVQAMDRQTGTLLWYGNPSGGESIATITPAFSNDGKTIYVVNDATADSQYPQGHPLMAFPSTTGPSSYRHNGGDPSPWQLSSGSPTIAADGRIFMHSWVDRPYAGTDDGSAIATTWAAATSAACGLSDPALYNDGGQLKVVIGSRNGAVYCYDGAGGGQLWSSYFGITVDASVTIDPANGNVYVGAGSDSVYVIGLDKYGNPLWGTAAKQVFAFQSGVSNPQRAQSAGCLSHDGSTYYFQSNSAQGDGSLYAINTSDGSVKWSLATGSAGWEMTGSSPIVTPDGLIIVGNNDGGTYYAIKDDGTQGTLIDTITVDSAGNARASATLAPDGKLYLPLRTIWSTPNGGGAIPTSEVANVFTCIDLTAGATAVLAPPAKQAGAGLNHSVSLSWKPIIDPTGQFDHYAVYRATTAFTSVEGRTPIATLTGVQTSGYTDTTAVNGVRYHYAVTSVAQGGGEVKTINSFGPFTPRDETDLQVLSVSRTPRYPRYAPNYTTYQVTEPSGFGPYIFSAATSLGQGQTGSTQRWPNIGDTVTYTATIRNRGTNTWTVPLQAVWRMDGAVVSQPSKTVSLAPGDMTTFVYQTAWDGQSHDIGFTMNVTDARPANNSLTVNSKSVAFLTYADKTAIEKFRENTLTSYPQAKTDDLFDWLNNHMAKLNQMFAAAGSPKRINYGILEPLNDTDPDPSIDRISFAIFPFRYHSTDGDPRGSGYYNPTDDIDYGLLHEEGHQLGLIDIYQLDLPADANQVSGQGYSAVSGLMHGCSPFLSEFSALGMTDWLDKAHGYYGQFMYNLPSTIRLRILGFDGLPLEGAVVKMYQYCERPGVGKVITNQIKAQGVTDDNGFFVVPNVPIDPAKVPPAYTGDTLHDNPFGYLAVVGSNGVLHFRVEYGGGVDYCWLDVTECMAAYFHGETATATFDRQLALGGPIQHYPPDDLAELNANDWAAWAQGSAAGNTYVVDDTRQKIVGSGSVKFVTDGGFDTYIRYPRTFTAFWDLRSAASLQFRVYAVNPNMGFQSGSPWIRLKDADGNYFQYQYYQNGYPTDILNQALNTWKYFEVPLNASSTTTNGWRRTTLGTPDLSRINSLEIHSDTWGDGFTLWYDGVGFTFTGTPAGSINAAKSAPDGSRAGIEGAVISAVWPDFFYIQNPDRSSGIRVEKPGHGLTAGQTVDVYGIMKTTSDGERAIDASWAASSGGTADVRPLLMTNRDIGGGGLGNPSGGAGQNGVIGGYGLNNIGLLIKSCGKVVERDTSPTPTWYKIDDGSGVGVKVVLPSGTTVPALDAYVTVTGVSSCYTSGGDLYSLLLVP